MGDAWLYTLFLRLGRLMVSNHGASQIMQGTYTGDVLQAECSVSTAD